MVTITNLLTARSRRLVAGASVKEVMDGPTRLDPWHKRRQGRPDGATLEHNATRASSTAPGAQSPLVQDTFELGRPRSTLAVQRRLGRPSSGSRLQGAGSGSRPGSGASPVARWPSGLLLRLASTTDLQAAAHSAMQQVAWSMGPAPPLRHRRRWMGPPLVVLAQHSSSACGCHHGTRRGLDHPRPPPHPTPPSRTSWREPPDFFFLAGFPCARPSSNASPKRARHEKQQAQNQKRSGGKKKKKQWKTLHFKALTQIWLSKVNGPALLKERWRRFLIFFNPKSCWAQ